MNTAIAIVGTLDTKEAEIRYLMELIKSRGHKTIIIDGGILGKPALTPDINREEIAAAAGTTLEQLIAMEHEGKAIAMMAEGASNIVQGLYVDGSLSGILAIGGTMGSSLGLASMRNLPVGMPKLMLSTIAFTPFVTADVVAKDQMMLQSAADLWGLNALTKNALETAAGAIVGMVEMHKPIMREKKLIGITTRGICKYPNWIKPVLEEKGYEVAVFHAVGLGGRTFESLILQGLFSAVLDLTTGEVIENLCGGVCDAGENRLEAAGKMKIPQIVAPGCMEYFNWTGAAEAAAPQFKGRALHQHNPLVLCVKATTEEMKKAAEIMASKLNMAGGPVILVIPLQGFDELDRKGGPLYDPDGRKAFIDVLKNNIKPDIKTIELDLHINDREFAEEIIKIFDKMITLQ